MITRHRLLHRTVLSLFVTLLASSANGAPGFPDYPAAPVFQGPNHPLLETNEGDDGWYAAMKKASQRKVNFAGQYVVFTDGCGGGAICGAILDAKTGRLTDSFPNAYLLDGPDDASFDSSFRAESRLLIIQGIAADVEVDERGKALPAINRERYYELKDGKLRLLESHPL